MNTINHLEEHDRNIHAAMQDLQVYTDGLKKLRTKSTTEMRKFKKAHSTSVRITSGPCRGYSYPEWDSPESENAMNEMLDTYRKIDSEISELRKQIKNLSIVSAFFDKQL